MLHPIDQTVMISINFYGIKSQSVKVRKKNNASLEISSSI